MGLNQNGIPEGRKPANFLPKIFIRKMPNQNAETQISAFLVRIRDRRFDEESLRILESVLVAKDVKSSVEVRSALRESMISESIFVFREIAGEFIDQKLCILEFFVRAFALIGDTESCLAVRYEALTLREINATRHGWLRVEHIEWIKFADDSIENGFYSIARKACENALVCLQRDDVTHPGPKESSERLEIADKIRRLLDFATIFSDGRSVQAETMKYLRSKEVEKGKTQLSFRKRSEFNGSTLFRDGIKNRNQWMLMELRSRRDCFSCTSDLGFNKV